MRDSAIVRTPPKLKYISCKFIFLVVYIGICGVLTLYILLKYNLFEDPMGEINQLSNQESETNTMYVINAVSERDMDQISKHEREYILLKYTIVSMGAIGLYGVGCLFYLIKCCQICGIGEGFTICRRYLCCLSTCQLKIFSPSKKYLEFFRSGAVLLRTLKIILWEKLMRLISRDDIEYPYGYLFRKTTPSKPANFRSKEI